MRESDPMIKLEKNKKKSKIENRIKECIKDLEKQNRSFSKMDKTESQDICDEYY